MRWSDRAVRAALGLAGPAVDTVYSGVSTDTRGMAAGALFVALQGERFDAHDFLAAATAAGATGAVVRRGTAPVPGLLLYPVEDTLRALGDLAHVRRKSVTGPVIAITGTNGKTSTKEMVAHALRTRYRTWATRINLNNQVGVPLTILEAPADTEALVIEAGASLPGEMARHRAVIEPSIAVITNVTAGHLEGFGGGDGVLNEKLSLLDGVPLALVGTDPPGLAELARPRARRVITAGLRDADRVPARVEVTADGRPRITIGGQRFLLDARGRHQAGNAMLAWAVAEALGLDLDAVARSLESLSLPGGRGELTQHGGLSVLHDAYNANPASFRAAIELARSLRATRRLVFVAGTMRELGESSGAHHAEIASLLVALRPDVLGAVGEFVPALEPYRQALGNRLITAPDAALLGPKLAARIEGDELVVLKGSRGVALERILPDLVARSSSSTS
ncbi:MAG TPA: UDP-N-acetylmuramoyl-tripeptide--D-alanyl-D-alanine ligase [Gemmatimonadales bacterium]|nr:UDP-N-acetylmuramoyl-tripeptide--D-alanyl-D-alanine ligase [Gemmatimonadales bacterium]